MEVLVFLLWIGLTIAVGAFASGRGRTAFGWGLLAFLISPVIAFIILAVLPDLAVVERDREQREQVEARVEKAAQAKSLRVQGADVALRIEKLRQLREKGLLTEPEYVARKQKVFNGLQGKQLVESSEDFLALLIPLIENGALTPEETTRLKTFAFQDPEVTAQTMPAPRREVPVVAPPGWRCPLCGKPAMSTQNTSSYVCENMHMTSAS